MATVGGEANVESVDHSLAGAGAQTLADPGAWAVTAFATTSFMLGMYNTNLIGPASLPIVLPVAFFFGGLIQIIVGILEIGRGNVFGAVVFWDLRAFLGHLRSDRAVVRQDGLAAERGGRRGRPVPSDVRGGDLLLLPGVAENRCRSGRGVRVDLHRLGPAGDWPGER